jgi:hypothetical protein
MFTLTLRPVAADFMKEEFRQEQTRFFKEIDKQRAALFIKGKYQLEEGEILDGFEDCDTINKSLDLIFRFENISTKQDLDIWCRETGRKKLYNLVAKIAPNHYYKLKAPDASIRAYYETKLIGYKHYTGL